MKRVITAFLIISIIFLISGCKSQKDLNTENSSSGLQSAKGNSSAVDDYVSAPSDDSNSESDTSQQAANINRSNPAHTSAEPGALVACRHTYKASETAASCTAEGYIVYTCTKCSDSYRRTLPASHDYSKYLCERCGKIDPSADKFWAMNAWLTTYGEPNGKGNFNCYPNEFAPLAILNCLDQNTFFIKYVDSSDDTLFWVFVQGGDISTVQFDKGGTYGSYDIKNSALSSAQKIVFDEFRTSAENPIDEDVFATECAKKIDQYMLKAQNEIIYPKTGLKLRDFGFTSYQ